MTLYRPPSVGGTSEVSPAREGWVHVSSRAGSAVGATHFGATASCLVHAPFSNFNFLRSRLK
jgi:hypothetical protein